MCKMCHTRMTQHQILIGQIWFMVIQRKWTNLRCVAVLCVWVDVGQHDMIARFFNIRATQHMYIIKQVSSNAIPRKVCRIKHIYIYYDTLNNIFSLDFFTRHVTHFVYERCSDGLYFAFQPRVIWFDAWHPFVWRWSHSHYMFNQISWLELWLYLN